MNEEYELRLGFEFLYKLRALLVKCIHCGARLSVFLSYIFTFCAGFIPPCKMEFIPRINQIRLSGSQNVGRKPVYSGEDNPDIASPPPRFGVYTSFSAREAEKRQVLSSPRLSVAKYWFEYGYGAVEAACHRFMSF